LVILHASDNKFLYEGFQNYKVSEPGRDTSVYFHYAHGQVGMSVHFTEDEEQVIVGAPGVFNWHGKSKSSALETEFGYILERRN